jgi:hypothetical protein
MQEFLQKGVKKHVFVKKQGWESHDSFKGINE